jgi:hypothetical protein
MDRQVDCKDMICKNMLRIWKLIEIVTFKELDIYIYELVVGYY